MPDRKWQQMKLRSFLPLVVFAILSVLPAHASLTFQITYDPTVQGRSDFAQIQSAVNFVKNEFSARYIDPISLNFTIVAGNVGLGQSETPLIGSSYGSIRNALVADAKSADDASFVAAFPATDPVSGTLQWFVPRAQAKAIGLLGASGISDGTYTFNSTATYTFDPNNRKVVGAYDFIGVTEHEFSELMGRISALNDPSPVAVPFDLARFTANGARSFAPTGVGVYFSVDNGATNLKNYNGSGSGDIQDWDQSDLTDPFNASTGTDQGHVLSNVDFQVLDVAGYDLAIPEPATMLLLGAGLLALGVIGRKAPR